MAAKTNSVLNSVLKYGAICLAALAANMGQRAVLSHYLGTKNTKEEQVKTPVLHTPQLAKKSISAVNAAMGGVSSDDERSQKVVAPQEEVSPEQANVVATTAPVSRVYPSLSPNEGKAPKDMFAGNLYMDFANRMARENPTEKLFNESGRCVECLVVKPRVPGAAEIKLNNN